MIRARGSDRDFRGDHVPLRLIEAFDISSDLHGILARLAIVARDLAKLEGKPGMELVNAAELTNGVAYLRNLVDHWRPYMVCPECAKHPVPSGACECEGRGWLPLAKSGMKVLNARVRRERLKKGGKPIALQNIAAKAKVRGLV